MKRKPTFFPNQIPLLTQPIKVLEDQKLANSD